MAEQLTTNLDQLLQGVRDTGVSAEDLNSRLTAVRSVIMDLEGLWAGRAHTAFNNLMTTWDDSATRLTNALNQISQNLQMSESHYSESEQQQEMTISAPGAQLDAIPSFDELD